MKKLTPRKSKEKDRETTGEGDYSDKRRDKRYACNEGYNIALWLDRSATSSVIYRLTYKSSLMLTRASLLTCASAKINCRL